MDEPTASYEDEPGTSGAHEPEASDVDSPNPSGAPDAPHTSVLLEAVLDWLRPRPGVAFRALDCTVGAGGHSFGLLERSSPDGRLIGLDADPRALELAAAKLAPFQSRFALLDRNFGDLAQLDLQPVDAILFDLGLSSMQLESSGRGFSFRFDEPLDMRFESTAAELLNSLPEVELERLLREYGEEPRARRVARSIVQRRQKRAFQSTGDLVEAVASAPGGARGRIHPATRTFQALRIAVNDERSALEAGLDAAVQLLRPGGRMAVISFHSLEDRMVKWRFRGWADEERVHILTRKPVTPTEEEVQTNPRARSAKLRVIERIA